MSLLASLAFVFAAIVVVAALRSTIGQFANAALGNLAALRNCDESREYRIRAVTLTCGPAATGQAKRIGARGAARRVRLPKRLRAAA